MILSPGLVLIAGAFLLFYSKGVVRKGLTLALPLAMLVAVWLVPDGPMGTIPFLDYDLAPVEGDNLSRLFGTIFSIMAFAGGLFALRQENRLEISAAFVYAGGAVCVAFAGDLITMFIFWEVMAVASTMILWASGTQAAYKASIRYVLIHLLGGVILMVGIAGHVADTGSIEFTAMQTDTLAHWLILAGFLVNAGAPPFSAWLPDAYPEASWSGTVFLSAFTTKTAVYVLIRGFPGAEILIGFGIYMILYGLIYALLENDMRRILAYSIINQVGFMVVGVGIGTEMAINGAASHAFSHILYKALLLMSAGSVLLMTGGLRKCTDLGGLFQSMPFTTSMAAIGALASLAFPFTSGFISKTMITQAAIDEHFFWVWIALSAGSAAVILNAGLKYPWFVFFQKDSGLRPKEPPVNMRWAMALIAFLCLALGFMPEPFYAILPYKVNYVPYTTAHVVAKLQLLLFGALAFFIALPYLKKTLTITLDFDWFYRRLLSNGVKEASDRTASAHGAFFTDWDKRFQQGIAFLKTHHGEEGIFARTWPSGSMALWAAILLGGFLIIYYY